MTPVRKPKTVLANLPATSENPLLGGSTFHDFVQKRFRRFTFQSRLESWLKRCERANLIRPAWVAKGTWLYSTFQIYQIWHCSGIYRFRRDLESVPLLESFDQLLRLLVQIQDYYLPLVRSDCRIGLVRGGSVAAVAGSHFTTTTSYVRDALRRQKDRAIEHGDFQPRKMLEESGLTPQDIRAWVRRIAANADYIDPMSGWQLLVRFVRYDKRQELRYDALLANDFRDLAEILRLFHEDASDEPVWSDLTECSSSAPGQSWMTETYGDSLEHPYEMLEFLANEFGLNPKPQAIVFTEGEEWRALERLYTEAGARPSYAGIEFRSLGGVGGFSVANWQTFIEYMHEKQTLVYFVVDKEGRAEREARKLLAGRRRNQRLPLSRVIPDDRIWTWATSFEESNFTDEEIVEALSRQGISVAPDAVNRHRNSGSAGLITLVAREAGVSVDKKRLVVDLADLLIAFRRCHRDAERRPVEKFISSSGQLIVLNHQPHDPEGRKLNFETGLLG